MRKIKFDYVFKHKKTGHIFRVFEDIEEIEMSDYWGNDPDMKDYELIARRQFIGLKDMNGKEIHEGDIIEREAWGYHSVYKIVWFGYGFGYEIITSNAPSHNPKNKGPFQMTENMFFMKYDDSKIIGNIYENPELLKKVN